MQREIEFDITDLFKYLIGRARYILPAVVICMLCSFGAAKLLIAPVYESQSMIYITTSASGSSAVQSMLSSLQAGNALTADYKTLATSKPVLEQVIEELSLDMTYAELKDVVSTENPDNTRILILKVRSRDPAMAKEIVDKLTEIERDKIADVMNTTRPNVMQWGDIQTSPVSASPFRVMLNTGFIAAVLILGFFTVLFIRNDNISSAEDIEKTLGLRNLAEIPVFGQDAPEAKMFRRRASKWQR